MTRKELILDKNIKIIYNKLENIKLNQGYIDLSNSSIQNKNDLVDVCNIFRDPRYETFRIFYMRDNKIVGQEAMTSKIPDGVFIFNEKTGDSIRSYEKMTNRMKRLNADGYYLPKEQILDNSVLNTVEEKLIDNSFYNMKISSRDELIALFMKMQKVKQVICLKFKT